MKYGVIYKAINIINSEIYIGQTVDFIKRVQQHKSVYKRNIQNTHLYRAIKKYDWDNFSWKILYDNVPIQHLNNMEKWCISNYDTFNNGYNSTAGGDSGYLDKGFSEEHKKKLKDNHKGTTGMKHTPEWSAKISKALSGRKTNKSPWNKKPREERNCVHCSKVFITTMNSKRKFCSHKCSADIRIGTTPWNKGLNTKGNHDE